MASPIDIAKLISEDVTVNNGLLYEDKSPVKKNFAIIAWECLNELSLKFFGDVYDKNDIIKLIKDTEDETIE